MIQCVLDDRVMEIVSNSNHMYIRNVQEKHLIVFQKFLVEFYGVTGYRDLNFECLVMCVPVAFLQCVVFKNCSRILGICSKVKKFLKLDLGRKEVCKMAEEVPRTTKNQALKRVPSDMKDQNSMKQNKRGKSSVLMPLDFSFGVCNNPACRATQSTGHQFCKRCSCFICHQFDDNKDPSLWLECTPDSGLEGSCGFSCHIECALQHQKVGVNSCQLQLDGSYCCASCGKVSSIIGCWKKQLKIAMDAHRVDVLCYRIFLSYRLLDGTSRFKELHKLITDLKAELEIELGPLNEAAAKMSRGHAGRLHAASHVRILCTLAIEKAEELLTTNSSSILNFNEGSDPSPKPQHKTRTEIKSDSGFKVQDTRKSLRVVLDQEQERPECFCSADTKKCDGFGDVHPKTLPQERLPTSSTEFDLNTTPVPDLNEELHKSDTTNKSQFIDNNGSGGLDDNFANIVKTICGLEHGGHVGKEFRLKFLTWFSLRSREHERRVVRTFVKTLIDDPSSLAGQLVDTFSDIIFSSRP
ncbi:hypothetical protein Pfo_008093 [Paulownia fortunei]|nr:hypothetical protein Pfo_008093 [Paulownia fortunei]